MVPIIISKDGKDAKKVTNSDFENEGHLQKYLFDNPDIIQLDEIAENEKLVILCREFPTSHGPIDELGIDQEGNIYIIETKLFKNPDKRTVIAQALDYGASLWSDYQNPDEFMSDIERELAKYGTSLSKRIGDSFNIGDDQVETLSAKEDALRIKVQGNRDSGRFRFIILMDKVDERLRDLITFVNRNSKFTIYALEMKYYKHGDLEIIIPKLFGLETKKDIVDSKSPPRKSWDQATFFQDASGKVDEETLKAMKQLYQFSVDNGYCDFGTGGTYGTFRFHLPIKGEQPLLFGIASNGVNNNLYFGNLQKAGIGKDVIVRYIRRLKDLGLPFKDGDTGRYPEFKVSELTKDNRMEEFERVFRDMKEEFSH